MGAATDNLAELIESGPVVRTTGRMLKCAVEAYTNTPDGLVLYLEYDGELDLRKYRHQSEVVKFRRLPMKGHQYDNFLREFLCPDEVEGGAISPYVAVSSDGAPMPAAEFRALLTQAVNAIEQELRNLALSNQDTGTKINDLSRLHDSLETLVHNS